jgi:hypothetical protein
MEACNMISISSFLSLQTFVDTVFWCCLLWIWISRHYSTRVVIVVYTCYRSRSH